MITQQQLLNRFIYKDGHMFYRHSVPRRKAGSPVGFLHGSGYMYARIDYKMYGLHRLIFLYHNGYLPALVDHIDRNKLNNKIDNLRDASYSINSLNRDIFRNNTSGHRGIHMCTTSGKWVVRVCGTGPRRTLGRFTSLEEAVSCLREYENTPSILVENRKLL